MADLITPMQHRDTATPFLFLTTSAAAVLQLPKVESLGAGTGELQTKESNMQLLQEHQTWFRTRGQFLEPAGDVDSPKTLAFLERYSQSVREDLEKETDQKIEEAADAAREEEKEECKENMSDFKEKIITLVNESDTTEALEQTLEQIRKLCED